MSRSGRPAAVSPFRTDRCTLPESSRPRIVRLLLGTTLALLFLSATPASAACALIGDSIAADLRPFLRECRFAGRIGIGTAAIVSLVPSNAEVIVVSAGTNDYLTPGVLTRLQALRSRAGSAITDRKSVV